MSNIRRKVKQHSSLIQNFGYLSLLQVFTVLVPLLTIPYLLKVLGKDTYGLIVFAQAIVSYFLILINFGFNLSATKEVSVFRNDKKKLSEIVSSVIIIKGTLFLLSFLLLWISLIFIPEALDHKTLFYLMMYLCVYEWLFPIWYFQGIEKMKYITFFNLISKSFFLLLFFFLIKQETDYLKVPLLNGIGSIISALSGLYMVFFHDKIKFEWQSVNTLKHYIKESLPLFLSSIAGRVKILSNKAILGVFVGMESVAIYDIVDKIKNVFLIFLQLVGQVLYPNISVSKNKILLKNSLRFLFLIGVIIYVMTGISINIIIPIYFKSYMGIINLFWILGLLVILQPVSYLIGTSILLVNNLSKQYSVNLYISTGIYLLLIVVGYLLNSISALYVSIILILSAFAGLTSNIIVCKKNNLLKWII